MELISPRCAGLDVPQKTVVVWARRAAAGAMTPEVHPFGTTTRARLALGDWLASRGITPGGRWRRRGSFETPAGVSSTASARSCSPTRGTGARSRGVRAT